MNIDSGENIGFGEFVALMAMLMSLVALSIDTMLPALSEIGRSLGARRVNDPQLVIPSFFLGMSAGQLIYGPLSDSIGRKPAIFLGLLLYLSGSLVCLLAASFPVMLAGRAVQGFGAAAPRIVSLALVRDRYSGRAMARVMSFVMSLFILVPIVAPMLGQFILTLSGWRAIFGAFLLQALIVTVWFGLRMPETLPARDRTPISAARLTSALIGIVTNRRALGCTIISGLVSGAFMGFLNCAFQIFQDTYAVGRLFPLYFSITALSVGCAGFVNGRMVMKFGMRRLTRLALVGLSGLSSVFWIFAWGWAGQPPVWTFMAYLITAFFCVGVLFGNINALAMEPLGRIAGLGAAVVGSLSTFISLILGVLIGQSYAGTILPLLAGFSIYSLLAVFTMRWVDAEPSRLSRNG